MRIKKKLAKPLIAVLVASQCVTAFGGSWVNSSAEVWRYQNDDGTFLQNGWFLDPADGKWYYLDEQGVMTYGWKYIDNVWYFFNPVHDGTFGSMAANGWQWIDGYCYLFGPDGKMYANTVTPDGFTVNADGQWLENGVPVFVQGKGIQTKTNTAVGPSGPFAGHKNSSPGGGSGGNSGGGGSSGGGGGGSSSSQKVYYAYTVQYVDEAGNVLASTSGEARKNSFVTIARKEFAGFQYVSGQDGSQKLTKNNMTFVVRYQKEAEEKPEEKPDEKEAFSYTVTYINQETGEILKTITGTGEKGTTVTVKPLSGYQEVAGNEYSFILTEDNLEKTLYFTEKVQEYSYKIRYVADDDTVLAEINGTAKKDSVVAIPQKEFEGYTADEIGVDDFVLDTDKKVVEVLYTKDDTDEEATDSEPEKELWQYTIRYIDRDTNEPLATEKGSGKEDDEIVPDMVFEDYEYAGDYSFTLTKDKEVFTVYLVSTKEEEDIVSVPYTVTCVDEDDTVLKVMEGTVSVGDEDVIITPEIELDGYERVSDNTFTVSKTGNNAFTIVYERIKDMSFAVLCMDIVSGDEIERMTLYGNVGDTLDLSDICPDGFERVDGIPEDGIISDVPANNYVKLYFREIREIPDVEKEANFTVRFREKGNESNVLSGDLVGTWTVGELLPIYFHKELTDQEGNIYEAIDESPRTFRIKDVERNQFTIYYKKVKDAPEAEDLTCPYSIRYLAKDTEGTLGIMTGFGKVGEKIPFRNTFYQYGFANPADNSYAIQKDGDNIVDVILERKGGTPPDKNDHTGLYDGCAWLAVFVDSNGTPLLPNVSGFSVKGDRLYIDYPNVIEADGVTYRAVEKSPYIEDMNRTVYKQIIIQYVTGEPSEEKLESWKNKAQEKKDGFYGTTPYNYYVAYREKNSWNDIGLVMGMAHKDSTIQIEAKDMPGWHIPEENLGDFTLDQNGKVVVTQYERPNGGTSTGYLKQGYEIHAVDEEGNDLFAPYKGSVAFKKGNSSIDFRVYYPNVFYDAEGNRWEADEESPKDVVLDNLTLNGNRRDIAYHQVYENEKEQFIVESNADFNRILNEFASYTYDRDRHDLYMIGRDYDTARAEVSDTLYRNNLAGYSNEVVDRFELNGVSYTVSRVSYYRKWDQASCTHVWEIVEDVYGNCLVSAEVTVRCEKCGKEHIVYKPAVGHVDENYDSFCDECQERLSQTLGDTISVTWNPKDVSIGVKTYDFVCVDTDYQGSGKMLYVSKDGIGSEIYGTYTDSAEADYLSSSVRMFLDDRFADGLSVSSGLQPIEGDAVSMLTKEEYDQYRAAAENQYRFPAGTYLTKSNEMDHVILTDGSTVSKEDASNYNIHPTILLNRSEIGEGIQDGVWKVGDMQVREVGDKLYLFRCVNANYQDKSNTDKSMALFVCDTVIPSNEGLGFDEADETQSTRFFGKNNNYKDSTINQWLNDYKSKTGNLVMTNIGIANEYTGKSKNGAYQTVDVRDFTKYTRSTPQVMYSNFFIPSLEEALAMKDYLWKFHGSDKNNASEIINNYRASYWLRTPVHGTDDMVYTVNLRTGAIEPKSVKATEGNQVSNTGIRPMYVVEQSGS